MLYISRRVGRNTFGVVDTDDYVEEVVSWKEIEEAVLQRGLDIVGIKRNSDNSLSYDVEVYQDPAFTKPVQGKASVLYGVNIKMSGTEIVDICVPNDLRAKEVRIKLSDYGKSVSKRVLNIDTQIGNDKKLILVVDDNIRVRNKSFEGAGHFFGRVLIDVTAVTDERIVTNVYSSDNYREIDYFVLDGRDRLEFYLGVGILQNGRGFHSAAVTLKDEFSDPDRVAKQLGEKFGKSFRELVAAPIKLKDHPAMDLNIDLFWRRAEIVKMRSLYKSNMLDTGVVCKNAYGVFWGLRTLTTANAGICRRFENYVTEFNVSEEYRKLMLRLAVKVIKFFEEYLEERERKLNAIH